MRGKELKCEEKYAEALPFFVKWVIHDRNGEEALEGLKDCFIKAGRLEDGI
jgi:thioredoxin-like negative regulator of GroEL